MKKKFFFYCYSLLVLSNPHFLARSKRYSTANAKEINFVFSFSYHLLLLALQLHGSPV